jgi:hypothetical protein
MFAEDLSTFFDTSSGFAINATVAGQTVSVIFDKAIDTGTVGPYGMASTEPSIILPTAQVPANPVGATVVVNSVTYLVATHEPDGTGVSRMLLEAVA